MLTELSLRRPIPNTSKLAIITPILTKRESVRISFLRGISVSRVTICFEIAPITVRRPVSTTTAFPKPLTTKVPLNTMLCWSPRATGACSTLSATLDVGRDSPVRADSLIDSVRASTMRASAGTLSPSRSKIISPGTTSASEMVISTPPRITTASVFANERSASSVLCALPSCTTPITALRNKTPRITSESVTSPRKNTTTLAISKM